jgi:hypothetical protein
LSPRELLTKRLEDDLALLGPNLDLMLAVLSEVLADPAMRAQYYQRMVMTGITGVVEHLDACQQRGETNIPNISMAARIFVSAMLGLKLLNILGDTTVRDASKKNAQLAESMAQVLFDSLQPQQLIL